MAVSRCRFPSISELQLPYVFNKERPFETRMTMAKRSRQAETQEDRESGHDQSLKLKVSNITIEEDSCNNVRVSEEECHTFFECQRQESNRLAGTFASHQMALERIQENMRTFLQENARQLKLEDGQPVKTMSEQEREAFRHIEMEMFRNMKLVKLNQLFRASLFHEICLRRIQIIASKDLELFREAILATEEIVQIFQEKLLDHNFTIEMYEAFDARFLDRKEKVQKRFEDSVFFEGQLPLEDEIRYTMTESRISFVLGLEVDFLEKLTLYDDEIMFHCSIQEWILDILSSNYEDIDDEDLRKNLSKVLLAKLGFRENSKAIETILTRSALMSDHVEPVEFAKRFVKDELKYNPVLSQKLYRFPFINQANIQYVLKVKTVSKELNVINAARGGHSEPVRQYITEYVDRLSDTESVVMFHGTDHCSALDIIHRGIDVRLGQRKQDFSDGCGFYLTNNYEHAQTWSVSQTRKPAVLVFKVHKSFLESSSCLNLSKDENKSEWLQIVKECRSGRPSKKLRKRLKTYDIVEGPISKRSDDVNEPFEPRQGSHQLCVINRNCAVKIREFLDTAIFFE